jgi:D-arabinose 1-dehydrogenase-like Zn-dependent alcohol dehydrogenase
MSLRSDQPGGDNVVNDYRALVIAKPGSIRLEEASPVTPRYGEVIARPAFVGVCGTDLELLDGVVDPAYVRYPLIPGHEWAGMVTAVGPGVSGFEPGQVVISEGIIPDRVCDQCVDAHADAYATLRHGTGPRGKVLIEVVPR